jgi:predicted methyltransferase
MICSEDNTVAITQLVSEMYRVLKPGGVYIIISHGASPSRIPHLSATDAPYKWSIDHVELREDFTLAFISFLTTVFGT